MSRQTNNYLRVDFGIVHFIVLAVVRVRVRSLCGVFELRGFQGLHHDHLSAVVQGRGFQVVNLDDFHGFASSAGADSLDDLDAAGTPVRERRGGGC